MGLALQSKRRPPSVQSTLVPGGAWPAWSDERLLDVRLCDLPLKIEGSPLADRIIHLYHELEYHRLLFRPHFWLSNEWFCPDGVPGIAVPFYMVHPRLARLELTQMLEVEGGTPEWCMRILRHETGHAIENAYRLRSRRRRRQLFGRTSEAYPEYYTPKPYSKSFVQHLDMWYAQSHPDEDFAETFAVWLDPESRWRERYVGWPALRKLEYMDGLMRELAGARPRVTTKEEVDPLPDLRRTLRKHYERKRRHYGVTHPHFYDPDLRRLFSDARDHAGNPTAASFLMQIRRDVRRKVANWTGEYQYTIDQVLQNMIVRCRELKLRLTASESQTKLEFTILLTVQTMNYLHSGRHRVAL
ncbi:MAG: putative zinc-binding metallopeptidase [Nitrospirae bacterium]|nr:putative zinc-binding metallopeptidase [Nitrospirota bacterium]